MATNTGACPKCGQINSYTATNCLDCNEPLPWAAVAAQARAALSSTTPVVNLSPAPADTKETRNQLETIGLLLMGLGGLAAVYFFLFFDVSVSVPGNFLGISRVNNLGLMSQRQNGITMGLGAMIFGGVLFGIGTTQPKVVVAANTPTFSLATKIFAGLVALLIFYLFAIYMHT